MSSDYFPIRVLSQQTGVNSITLRAWERRYGLLKPFRTEKGHRLYCHHDIERVRRILYWVNQGVSVGKVRSLLELREEESQGKLNKDYWLDWQRQFIADVMQLNQSKWEQRFREASKQYPVTLLLKKGLLPVLQTLRNQKDSLAARLCLQSALVDLIIPIKANNQKAKESDVQVLVINVDNSSLMAHLACWSLSESNHPNQYIEGVKSATEVLDLIRVLNPDSVVLIAENLTQTDAGRWLECLVGHDAEMLHLVGAGFWLAMHEDLSIKRVRAYSDVSFFL